MITEEPINFTATFDILITGIKTTDIDNLTDVVKLVEWTIRGTKDDQIFELKQKTELGDPDPNSFIPLKMINDPQTIVSWVEENEPRLNSIKAHIQFVLDKMTAENRLSSASLPWLTPNASTN